MPDDSTILAGLADEFTAKVRAGDLPAIEDYATRHPDLAERIRALFPTLLLLEGMARGGAEPVGGVELTPGSRFGLYTIVAEIGRGGMGIVYEAVHETLRRRVALKVLPLAGPQAPTQLERFLREARTAAGLHHTNIVPVFDVGQVNGVPYYAMQLIAGRGLDAVLRDLAHPPKADPNATHPLGATAAVPTGDAYYRWVAELGVQAAEALAHAHQRGVVHRDVKPSNLLLDDEGVLWVTDFGLARMDGDAALTHTGQLVGTPRYMSPEQAGAAVRPIDHRTDLYSLGATLYELLTRRPPVDGATPQEVLRALLQRDPVAPRRLDAKIPRDLETAVLKAMSRQPDDRYASAQALADDLRRYLDHRPLKARRVGVVGRSVRWAKRNPAVAGMAAALLVSLFTFMTISSAHAIRAREEADRARHAEMQAREAQQRAFQAHADRDRQEARRLLDQGLDYAARAELVPAVHWFARPIVQGLPLDAAAQIVARQRLAAYERYGGLPRPLGVVAAAGQEVADLHPDGKTLLRRTDRPALELLDLETRQVRATFPTPGGATLARFLDGGKRIVAVCAGVGDKAEPVLLVLDPADGRESFRLPLPFAARQGHLVESGKAVVVLGEGRKELAVCKLGDEKPTWERIPLAGNEPVEGVSSGPRDELYVVYRDHRVETWRLDDLKERDEERWQGGSRAFQLTPLAGRARLLTLDLPRRGGGNACLWLPSQTDPEAEVEGLGHVMGLDLSRDDRQLLAAGSLATTTPQPPALWDVPGRRPTFRWPGAAAVTEARFLHGDRWAVLQGLRDTTLWELPAATPDGTALLGEAGKTDDAFLLPDAEQALVQVRLAADDKAPHRLDLRDAAGKVVRSFPLLDRHNGWFATRNGRFVVTFTNDAATVTVHEMATGQVVAELKRPASGRTALCLSEDGRLLLRLPREQKKIELIDVPTGKVVHTLPLAGQDEVALAGGFDLALSADGQHVASLLDGRVQMWDVESGDQLWTRVVPEATALWFDAPSDDVGGIPGLGFGSPGGGGQLVVAEQNGLRFWHLWDGQPLTRPLTGTDGHWVASWDGMSERLAVVRERSVVVWDANDARPITPPLAHPEPVRAARLAADGLTLTTLDAAGTRRVWGLSPDLTAPTLLTEKLERLYGYRMDDTGRVTFLPPE